MMARINTTRPHVPCRGVAGWTCGTQQRPLPIQSRISRWTGQHHARMCRIRADAWSTWPAGPAGTSSTSRENRSYTEDLGEGYGPARDAADRSSRTTIRQGGTRCCSRDSVGGNTGDIGVDAFSD